MPSPLKNRVGGLTISESIPLPPSPRGIKVKNRYTATYNIKSLTSLYIELKLYLVKFFRIHALIKYNSIQYHE